MANQTQLTTVKGVAQPAQRALAQAGYVHVEDLNGVVESELQNLHGMGPKALRILKEELQVRGLSFA